MGDMDLKLYCNIFGVYCDISDDKKCHHFWLEVIAACGLVSLRNKLWSGNITDPSSNSLVKLQLHNRIKNNPDTSPFINGKVVDNV